MKVIFLDFDGVLTNIYSRWTLLPKKCDLLGQILDATDAKIVISSSWRRNNLEDTIDFLTNIERNSYLNGYPFPFIDKVIDQTDKSNESELRFSNHECRGNFIQKWLNEHPDVSNYVILDDDDDMLECQQAHFVMTSWDRGLNENDVKLAIKILNNESV